MSKHILIVNSTGDTFTILHDRFVYWGYEVIQALTETELWKALEIFAVHGILVELKHADMLTHTFLAELRKHYPLTPILAMGDQDAKPILIRAVENGASDFLTTPIDLDLLWRKCYRLFP